MTSSLRRRRPEESGFTLVEVLIALSIMAIAFVAIVGGLGTFFRATRVQRDVANLDQRIRTYAEQIEYQAACGDPYPLPTPPAGYSVQVDVGYWDGANPAGFAGSCPSSVHRFAIVMTNAAGHQERLTVVKRGSVP